MVISKRYQQTRFQIQCKWPSSTYFYDWLAIAYISDPAGPPFTNSDKSLAPRRCDNAFKSITSTLVEVMAWCHRATSHNLSQCWPDSCRHMEQLGHNELTKASGLGYGEVITCKIVGCNYWSMPKFNGSLKTAFEVWTWMSMWIIISHTNLWSNYWITY